MAKARKVIKEDGEFVPDPVVQPDPIQDPEAVPAYAIPRAALAECIERHERTLHTLITQQATAPPDRSLLTIMETIARLKALPTRD